MYLSPEEWRVAEYQLSNKPDGTILRYSAVRTASGDMAARTKRPELFNTYTSDKTGTVSNTFHSFIKIDGEIFALAQGKTPEAIVGQGSFGKVKFIQNKKGELAVVKIETHNETPKEAVILSDLKLSNGTPFSRGKVKHPEKTKFYTHQANLGVSLSTLLRNYELQVCLVEPPDQTINDHTLYLYQKDNKLQCKFMENKNHKLKGGDAVSRLDLPVNEDYPSIEECVRNTLSDFERLKANIDGAEKNLTPCFCRKPPLDTAIRQNRLYLYLMDNGLNYAFKTQANQIIRATPAGEYHYIGHALCDTLMDEPLKKRIHASLGLYPHQGLFPLSLDNDRRLQIAIDICLELDALHRGLSSKSGTPYSHGDIKPENIVIDARGQCHFIDHGFSDTNPTMPATSLCGTPTYLPWLDFNAPIPTRQRLDLIALKRVLSMPQVLEYVNGKLYLLKEDREKVSVLTQEMVTQLKLSSYLDSTTFSVNDTAMTLAAILITAQLGLGLVYESLLHNSDKALIIVEYYKKHRNSPTLKKDMLTALEDTTNLSMKAALVEEGCFEAPQQVAKQQPVKFLATYFKKNVIRVNVDDMDKARALIEAIEAGFEGFHLVKLTHKEPWQIRGIARAKKFNLNDKETAFLSETTAPHASIVLGFCRHQHEAECYLQLCQTLSQLEMEIASLDPELKLAAGTLVGRMYKAIANLHAEGNRCDQFFRFFKEMQGAIKDGYGVLSSNSRLKSLMDFLFSTLDSLLVFYPMDHPYQPKGTPSLFFKPHSPSSNLMSIQIPAFSTKHS
ncbi:Protein kinase domain protein [Legionella rubrilucens]|uniref:Protein kinase domain protein n=1 Tax=Legionella rubrilucens TaxID=458 RepID=A0A0W0XR91_9GAMM|nr:serine/threonine-protein kinase [Legionella rubrilucens]KTD47245.1 Protein kinase domain protein [Legionella rubrilucens]